ncbi:bacterial alpha-L-rhamnosidase-domain-containing protein [Calycina marina]|uniref:alpha-L-rhamnosidase n=1 Tax=Calycina marina TaxID=1763456 RepID=A0A9P8CBJ9_9HELO|nr:bacterial alpha-L-rhamnosidase-domain-containing protein [Calycina marina]
MFSLMASFQGLFSSTGTQSPINIPLAISQVSFEHHHQHPLGIEERSPRISWKFEGDVKDWEQSEYEIEVKRSNRSGSFPVTSSTSLYVPWPDAPLDEAEAANIRVRASGQHASTPWSDWVSVETGLSDRTWASIYPITGAEASGDSEPKRPVYLRKNFSIPPDVESARLYITGLGLYEAEINGKRVGGHVLAPGWQSYNYRHVYDTYNVTQMLQSGQNVVGVVLGEGWFSGRLGFGGGQRNIYGTELGLLSVLDVTLKNGTKIRIPSDTTWESEIGPIITSEIYNGEVYDANLEGKIAGWSLPAFNSTSWKATAALSSPKGRLSSPDQAPIRRIQEIKPEKIFISPSGQTLVDFGQNMAGWLQVNVTGPAGTRILFQHAEVLGKDGEVALEPLRDAKALDTVILSGKGPLLWEPKFTYHGFRYVQVTGWPSETPLTSEAITAIVIHTDLQQTGWLETSNQLLNKFHSNVRWSMKSNFVSIPTDCPQRDERLGWSADAYVFGPTANFLYDTAGFWKSWHRDIWSEMSKDGVMQPPHFTPIIPAETNNPTAVWGDVVIGNPWNVYEWFGDNDLLEDHLPQAQNWLDTGLPRNEVGLWKRGIFQYGDWLDPLAPPWDAHAATTHGDLVADAYLIRMTEILTNISKVLKRNDLVTKYQIQHMELRDHFRDAWVVDGALANHTQTANALALAFDLLTNTTERDNAVQNLRSIIAANKHLVGTGFAGTPALGAALHKYDATEDFYQMLLQTSVPSWLYQVIMNGTTTWERWDSMLPDGSINLGGMTSFNHYAFGSVADWMHRVIGGISPAEPGWKKVRFAPIPGGDVTFASTKYLGPYGEVTSTWRIQTDGFFLSIRVPPNTRGEVVLPNTGRVIEVGSGQYSFLDAVVSRREL